VDVYLKREKVKEDVVVHGNPKYTECIGRWNDAGILVDDAEQETKRTSWDMI